MSFEGIVLSAKDRANSILSMEAIEKTDRDALYSITLLPLDAESAAESALLPGKLHGDPTDRFLIAGSPHRGPDSCHARSGHRRLRQRRPRAGIGVVIRGLTPKILMRRDHDVVQSILVYEDGSVRPVH
jgi:hypothetical protein